MKRSQYYDTIKGFAIILMIYGHCIQYGWNSFNFTDISFFSDIQFKFIYSFHMPLFATVSGMLFYKTLSRRSIKQLFTNRMTNVLIPILSWSVFSIILLSLKSIYAGNFYISSITVEF